MALSGGAGDASVGGSGGTGGVSTGPDAGSDAGVDASSDAAPEASSDGASTVPDAGDGGTSASPAAELDGFLFEVACLDPKAVGQCDLPAANRMKMTTLQFGGDPKVTYAVKLHFCGPIEARPYTGCASTQPTLLCVDGTARTDGFNATYPTYEIRVASPAHSYFLKNRDLKDDLMKVDYSATLTIKGGSTVIFATDGGFNATIFTSTVKGDNYTCPGVPGVQQPFAGQFIYTTVDSVAPMP